jgi:DHA2 family multidrug resistance protein-like MFS transporter
MVASGLPAGIPPEAAASARDTLGAAVGVAEQLPAELGGALLDVARAAFVQGLHLAAAISAAVAITAAIVAVIVLRSVPAGAQLAEQPDADSAGTTTREFDIQEAEPAA